MKIVNVPRTIKMDFDYNSFLKIKQQNSDSIPIGDEEKDLAFSRGVKFDKKDLSAQLNISWESKEILEATFGGTYWTDALDIFQNTDNLDVRFAEAYKDRIDKIDNVISRNPNLKEKRENFINRLDTNLNHLIELKARAISPVITEGKTVKGIINKIVSKHFRLDYEEQKNNSSSNVKSHIEMEFASLFDKIKKDLKKGVSLEKVKTTNLEDAKYIKSFRDIEALKKISNDATKMAIDIQVKIWDYHVDHNSNEQTFMDINNLVKKLNLRISQSGANDNLKEIFTSLYSFNDLMQKVENKLIDNK